MNREAEDLTIQVEQRVAPFEPILRRLGFREGNQNDNLKRIGASNWLKDLDVGKYDVERIVVVFEKGGSITIAAGSGTSVDYSTTYRMLTPSRLATHLNESLWMIQKARAASMDAMIARELTKIAREIASFERTAADDDLAAIKSIIPETRKAQAEYAKKIEEYRQETNRMWGEATRELEERTDLLLASIRDELVAHFKSSGVGVRDSSISRNLVEVFLGSDDGVVRQHSKVSAFISLTFEGREKADALIRNENSGNDVRVTLSDKSTVKKLIEAVKKADRQEFWATGSDAATY